jgi:hypothetical protein
MSRIPPAELFTIFEPALREHMKFRNPDLDTDYMMENIRKKTDNIPRFMELATLFPDIVTSLEPFRLKTMLSNVPGIPQAIQAGPSLRKNKGDALPLLLSNQIEEESQRAVPSLTGRTSSFSTPKSATAAAFDVPRLSSTAPASRRSSASHRPRVVPDFEPTVNKGLYIVGSGKRNVNEVVFDISQDEYQRAVSWAQQATNPHGLVYLL